MPRWSILFIDTFICAFALTLAFLLRFNFENIPEVDAANFFKDYVVLLSVRFISFLISKTYKGVVTSRQLISFCFQPLRLSFYK
jgi:hypothetical protein